MLKQYLLQKSTLFSFIFSIVILYFVFSSVNFQLILQSLKKTNIFCYLLSFCAFYLSISIRGYRWKLLLKEGQFDIKFLDVLIIYFLSMFVNSIVPAKLGDVYRSYLLNKRFNTSITFGIGTIFVERIFDLATMLAILLVCAYFSFLDNIPLIISKSIEIGIIFTLAMILIAFLSIKYLDSIFQYNKLKYILANFKQGLRSVSCKNIIFLLFLSIVAWLIEGLTVWFIFLSLKVNLTVFFSVFLDLSSSLLTAIPFTPSGLGVVEVGMSYLLKIVHCTPSMALSIVVLYRFISYVSIIIFGLLVFMLNNKTSKSKNI